MSVPADPRSDITQTQVDELLGHALTLADALRDRIAEVVVSGFEVEHKADRSLVTTADREAVELVSEAQRQAAGLNQGLIRVAVGLEHLDDITADLDRGLALF